MFVVDEIEVEEKPKTYVARGLRVNKDEINKVSPHYGNEMYCLDNNHKRYIEAILNVSKGTVDALEKRLGLAKEEVKKWETLWKEQE